VTRKLSVVFIAFYRAPLQCNRKMQPQELLVLIWSTIENGMDFVIGGMVF
jgi:hypothetical protein